jgi:MAC/Perforin domain
MQHYAIGSTTNLLRGLNSNWDPSIGQLDILYPAKQLAMDARIFNITGARNKWSFPSVTLHENALDLLDHLIPYQIANPSSIDSPSMGAGALLIGMKNNQLPLQQLSKTLGVDLGDANLRYALVRIDRKDGRDQHEARKNDIFLHVLPKNINPNYQLSEKFISASRQLPHAHGLKKETGLNLKKATRILEFFEEFGTHYISGIDFGDTILQVFSYSIEKFEKIKQAYANGNPFSDLNVSYFMQYTTNSATGIFGYVAQYGHIICLSHSEKFKATLNKNAWHEPLWSNKNSVFALLSNLSAHITYDDLNKDFIEQVPTNIQLTSLFMMIEQKRALLAQRIFKGASIQKYRTTIKANLLVHDADAFNQMLPNEQLVSFLSTPKINLYKARLDLSELQFVAPNQIKEVTLFANVLSAEPKNKNPMVIPGKKINLVAQTIDMRAEGQAKAIKIDDETFASLEIACNEFLGTLTIENASGTAYTVITDGLKFGLREQDTGMMPFVESDIRTILPKCLPLLINNMWLSMTFAEAVINDQTQSNSQLQLFIIQYLQWLAKVISAHTESEAALALRVRVMDLHYQANNRSVGSFVPLLPYQDYAPFVEKILGHLDRIRYELAINEEKIIARRQEELIIDTAKTLNDNIIASGQLISQIIDANVAQQNDLEAFYQSAIQAKEKEAAKQQQTLNDLNLALFDAQNQTQFAVQKYKSAVKQWEINENIKLGLTVATDLFNLGVHFAVPASSISATKELCTLAQYIQKTLTVLNASSKLYTDIQTKEALKNAQKALDNLETTPNNIFTLPWDEMTVHFNAILAIGPDVKLAKAELQEAFSNMVLRGKAVMSASASLSAVQRDIYINQQQTLMNQRQAKRLEQLKNTLNPRETSKLDKEGIDLIGLTSYLSAIQNQMLAILAQAFIWQDQALQYANLQAATPITSFSLMKFSAALIKQEQTTLEAKSNLLRHHTSITKPIDFIIEGVHPEAMTRNRSFKCTIRLDAPEFYPYVDVKVVSVVTTVNGIKSTDSGNYIVKLLFTGSFQDRDLKRNPRTFRTPYRERLYSYNLSDHHPNFSDEGKTWSENVSRITPFSTWEISLPESLNKGICFSQTLLDIRLSFVLEARIIDIESIKKALSISMLMSSSPQLSKETLVSAMYEQGSCTNGWDVVFSMGLSQINKSLEMQYEELKSKTSYKNEINVDTQDASYPGVTLTTRFTVNYGYPRLIFNGNNSTALLESIILPGSSIQRCTKIGDDEIICKAVETIEGSVLSAAIDLSLVHGIVNGKKVLSVSLEMEKGSFSISNIDLNDQTKVAFNQSVKAYFVQNKLTFLINQLDLESIPVLSDLKPSNFIFKPLKTKNANEMLQLYIMTGGRALLGQSNAYLNNIPEPLPLGYSSSLIIRSGLIFNSIIPMSFKKKAWTLKGVNPKKETKAWSGQFSQADISADVDLSPLNRTDYLPPTGPGGTGSSVYTSYTVDGGNHVSFSLANTCLEAQKDGQLYYYGNKNQTIHLTEATSYIGFSHLSHHRSLSTDFNLNVSAYLNFNIAGEGRNQTIEVKINSKTVTVDGHLSGGGPCSSDDLAAQVNQKVREQLPDQIKNQLEMQFDPISTFALKNILFPSNNYIQFYDCLLPGDLLLLGKFTAL